MSLFPEDMRSPNQPAPIAITNITSINSLIEKRNMSELPLGGILTSKGSEPQRQKQMAGCPKPC